MITILKAHKKGNKIDGYICKNEKGQIYNVNKHDVIKYINDGFVSNARVQVVFDEEQASQETNAKFDNTGIISRLTGKCDELTYIAKVLHENVIPVAVKCGRNIEAIYDFDKKVDLGNYNYTNVRCSIMIIGRANGKITLHYIITRDYYGSTRSMDRDYCWDMSNRAFVGETKINYTAGVTQHTLTRREILKHDASNSQIASAFDTEFKCSGASAEEIQFCNMMLNLVSTEELVGQLIKNKNRLLKDIAHDTSKYKDELDQYEKYSRLASRV